MIFGEGTELIRRPARDVYEFILDFEQYRKADHRIAGVTRVFHREEIEFPIPLAWIMEPYLGAWLAADTPQEMRRLKELLQRQELAPLPRGHIGSF